MNPSGTDAEPQWVRLKGPFTAGDLRALKSHGAITRLSITEQPLLTAALASGFEELPAVDRLWLWCDTTRAAMRHVLAVPRLRVLDVLHLKSPGWLEGFADSATLEEFRGNLFLTEGDLLEIASCPSLKELGAQSSELTDDAFDALLAMPALESLDLEGTRFDDAMAARLHTLPTLRRLHVGNTALTRRGLEHVAQLHELRSLDIWANQLVESDIELLAGMPHLEYLSVGEAGSSADEPAFSAPTLLARLQAIRSLKRVFLDGVQATELQRAAYQEHFDKVEFH